MSIPRTKHDFLILPAEVFVQLERIRKSGVVNMLERRHVQEIANRNRFYALVVWLEDVDRTDYMMTVFRGTIADRDLTEDEWDQIAVAEERRRP